MIRVGLRENEQRGTGDNWSTADQERKKLEQQLGKGGSLVAQMVKNPPAMWEIWVRSLGWEDPLKESKATHSGILA